MAGKPKRTAMIAELDRLTRAELGEGATHLDYADLWVSSGGTILGLARKLGEGCGLEIYREALSKYLTSLPAPPTGTLAQARARGAHALIDESIEIADSATNDDAQASALRVKTRQWIAERWNPVDLGVAKGPSVTVNIGTLMLEALRQPVPAITGLIAGLTEDAEIISIDAPST